MTMIQCWLTSMYVTFHTKSSVHVDKVRARMHSTPPDPRRDAIKDRPRARRRRFPVFIDAMIALSAVRTAALAETAEGTVTEAEVDDGDSRHKVVVTLDDGSPVDVQLDEDFRALGTEDEGIDDETGADDA